MGLEMASACNIFTSSRAREKWVLETSNGFTPTPQIFRKS